MLAFTLHAPLATPIYPSTPTLEPPSEVVASTFIGGCRANGLRAAYTAFCTQQTACDLCGGSCTPASFPSGMQLPRHNVPQYLGNAVWDGLARDSFGRTVSAMMGDPFSFVAAPEFDALRRLLQDPSLTTTALVEQMEAAWSTDARYEGARNEAGTRANFLAALAGNATRGSSGLTRAFLLQSRAWARIGPPSVRHTLEQMVRGQSGPVSREAATCAAVHLMDQMFVNRGEVAIMNDLPSGQGDMIGAGGGDGGSAEATGCTGAGGAGVPTVFEELYAQTTSALPDDVRDDPHNVIYTSPYQYNAHGWYGGNVSLMLAPASATHGSGMDIKWAIYRGCPMGVPPHTFCARRANWLHASTPASDLAPSGAENRHPAPSVDQGEMRTPNYKEPREVVGLSYFPWNTHRHCVYYDPADPACAGVAPTASFDMTSLARPQQWALRRYEDDESRANAMALVLAPAAVEAPAVVSIDYDALSRRFYASPPRPNAYGDETYIREQNYVTLDLPPFAKATVVPVWGVLYSCASTNLPAAYATPDAATDAASPEACAAARALRRHRNASDDDPLAARLLTMRLPSEWEHELAGVRIRPSDATVDLSAGTAVHGAAPRAVCVLSLAAATRMEATAACSAASTGVATTADPRKDPQ